MVNRESLQQLSKDELIDIILDLTRMAEGLTKQVSELKDEVRVLKSPNTYRVRREKRGVCMLISS